MSRFQKIAAGPAICKQKNRALRRFLKTAKKTAQSAVRAETISSLIH